jgi:hypothetical protein
LATPKYVRQLAALIVATAAALASSACGSNADAGPPGGAVNSAALTPSTIATASAPARPTTITSACELLSADVVVKVLGSSKGTKLQAKEQAPDGSQALYSCVYGDNKGREVLSLIAETYPDRADTVTESIDAIAKSSHVKTTRIDGVGADAVAYVSDATRILAFAVPYEKELRLVVLTGPSIIPQGKYTELAQHVASRL